MKKMNLIEIAIGVVLAAGITTGCGGPEEKTCEGANCGVNAITDAGNSDDGTTSDGGTNNSVTDAGVVEDSGTSPDATTMDGGDEPDMMDPDCEGFLDTDIRTSRTVAGDCVYVIDQDIDIRQDATLTIESGAILEFTGIHSIGVFGTLDVRGTPDNPVLFRSERENPRSGDWGNIYVYQGGSLRLDNTIVTHFSGLRTFDGTVQIFDSEIRFVRPSNQIGGNITFRGAVDIGQGGVLEFEGSTLADVEGQTAVGLSSFDADGIIVQDSVIERTNDTAFVFSGYSSSTPGVTIANSRIEGCGAAGSIFNLAGSTIELNEFVDNDADLSVIYEGFDTPSYNLTQNNFTSGSTSELSGEGSIDIDASDSYWGAGVNPEDVVDAVDGAVIVTTPTSSTPVANAGPM